MGGIVKYGMFLSAFTISNIYYRTAVRPIQVEGELTGYKVLRKNTELFGQFAIATLRIAPDVEKLIYKGEKCRAAEVFVEDIRDCDSGEQLRKGYSPLYGIGGSSEYRLGETIRSNSFDTSPMQCSNGIHFFLTLEEAQSFLERLKEKDKRDEFYLAVWRS